MEVLRDIAALDAKIRECDAASAVSDDALRQVFTTFRMDFAADLPSDPLSEAYHDRQMALYNGVSGKAYRLENEATPFNARAAAKRPFPWSTQSVGTAGRYLGAIAHLLRTLKVSPGDRVLEFGPGWGETTLTMARLGLDVTAVDLEANFCELIRLRAAEADVPVTVVNSDFMWAETITDPFDAIVFFECFHHCDDHIRLLRALKGALKPGGRIYFAAEPIVDDYPVPWGLRMDGESLWAIRKHGWLELGFRSDYFRKALRHCGFKSLRHASADLGHISVWEAWVDDGSPSLYSGDDPALQTRDGQKVDGRLTFDRAGRGHQLWGPYADLPAGRYRATLFLEGKPAGKITLDACVETGQVVLASRTIRMGLFGASPEKLALDFELTEDTAGLEVRLRVHDRFTGMISRLEIRAVD
ncbi:SAM-dependent methyltransferase [Asticcacaulis sp.]|uniref:SAM-dependent methyltransferase n=1 Tax=Asticcacaulis sp. TaxID=1872648 RepID=UPI003F7B590F